MINLKRKNQKGFTLTELLVAMVIGLLIIIIISSVFSLNQKIFRKSNIKSELIQNARINLDLMAREIRQAIEIVTVLPADDSNPESVPHELEFQDGHNQMELKYIRYYLDGTDMKRQVVVYYFETNPSIYVNWDDFDAFGPPEKSILEDKIIGENFSNINFFGGENITIDLFLEKQNEHIQMKTIINPRNI